MRHKFKVGDRVRVKKCYWSRYYGDKVYTIIKVWKNAPFPYYIKPKVPFAASELERVFTPNTQLEFSFMKDK